MRKLTIGTHNGVFHSDEIIAIAMINTFNSINASIIRSRNHEELEKADMLVDVGARYDGMKYFDHHQLREGDELYGLSSAGMVAIMQSYEYDCNDCGYSGENNIFITTCDRCSSEALVTSKPRWSNEKRMLVKAVDARDTRVNWDKNGRFEPLFNAVNDCNKLEIQSSEQDIMFKKLVGLFTDYFSDRISLIELQETVTKIGDKNKKIKNAIMADRFSNIEKIGMNGSIPIYQNDNLEYVDTKLFGNNPFIFISYDKGQDNYSIATNTDYCKIVGISNPVFIHANGFFAKTKSLDDLVIDIEEA